MNIVYIADDGKQFDDEFDCEHYEWVLNHPYLETIDFLDKDGNCLEDKFSEKTYDTVMQINVYTDDSVKDLQNLAEYTGFCNYDDITEPGVWIWGNKDEMNQGFIKTEKIGV